MCPNPLASTDTKTGYGVSGHEASFPINGNPRLESAEEADLGRIEISPFGLHWPTLDEDLSFAGMLDGRFGQHERAGNG